MGSLCLAFALVCMFVFGEQVFAGDPVRVRDPGVRSGGGASEPLAGLTPTQLQLFNLGKAEFSEAEAVADGLGPAMNLDNCGGCHSQPAIGGSSATKNPQIALAKFAAVGRVPALPSFVSLDGPVRVVRFVRHSDGSPDGDVHALLSIASRPDAAGCVLEQPDFDKELANLNISFRIPTPLFGAGMIEAIPDSQILANRAADAAQKSALGISGRPNVLPAGAGQTGFAVYSDAIGRFGWKAHNSSLLVMGAEAYNQEMGITNEIYQTEHSGSATCPYVTNAKDGADAGGLPSIDIVRRYRNTMGHRYPLSVAQLHERLEAFAARNPPGHRDFTDIDDPAFVENASSIERFAMFMRFLAPPSPSLDTPGRIESIARGRSLFSDIGCAVCHTPTLRTGKNTDVALRDRSVNLYSDLLLHDMGPGLADGISQGLAGPRDFRTAPLWGVGQRVYFLHDGRTSDLLAAVQVHRSGSSVGGNASEANKVIDNFNGLPETSQQDVLNFLRAL
jgi:CxxC motif-containing protein (DUF1111 family)